MQGFVKIYCNFLWDEYGTQAPGTGRAHILSRRRYATWLRYCTKLCLLGFSAISASFSRNFSGLWAGLGSCFKSFMDYRSTRACLLCYQPMAIVHYANLVLLNKYTFLTECRYARPGHRWRTRTLLQATLYS